MNKTQSTLATLICIFLGLSAPVSAGISKTDRASLYVVHIIPGDPTNYTVSREIADIEKMTRLAISDFRGRNPSCQFTEELTFKTGSESELFERVNLISKTHGRKVAVGFSRSSLARLAAKASQGSDLIGISIGASAEDLKTLNPNFVTMASPWREQWKVLESKMKEVSCSRDSTIIISDSKDSYSFNFRKAAEDAGFTSPMNTDVAEIKGNFDGLVKKSKCIFLAMNMSTSHGFLARLLGEKWKGSVFGTGDWYFYSGELNELVRSSKTSALTHIFVPTGWSPDATPKSKKMASKLASLLSHPVEPNGVYSYDAVMIALGSICLGTDPRRYIKSDIGKLKLIRSYEGIASGGNYLSPIRLVRFHGEK